METNPNHPSCVSPWQGFASGWLAGSTGQFLPHARASVLRWSGYDLEENRAFLPILLLCFRTLPFFCMSDGTKQFTLAGEQYVHVLELLNARTDSLYASKVWVPWPLQRGRKGPTMAPDLADLLLFKSWSLLKVRVACISLIWGCPHG